MQTKSKYLVWNEDQSDFEIHVPVILFDGIPLNNTCKADSALRMFLDTTSQREIQDDLSSILNSHRNKEVRQKATDYSRHLKTTILFSPTEKILRSLLKENDINIRAVELNAEYKSSIIKSIGGSSQRAIKSDIYFSSQFLDSLPNTYINHNNRTKKNPLEVIKANALRFIKTFSGDLNSLLYDEKIALIHFAINIAYKEYTGFPAYFSLDKLGIKGLKTIDVPIETSESFKFYNGNKINPEIWKTVICGGKNLKDTVIEAWKNMVPEVETQSFDIFFNETFEYISGMYNISPPTDIESDLLEQILYKTTIGFSNNLHLEHANFLIQLILVRTHWQAIENNSQVYFSFSHSLSKLETTINNHIKSKEQKSIITSLIRFYSQEKSISFTDSDIAEICASVKLIWTNLTGGYYASSDTNCQSNSSDHFDELLFLSKKPGTCFQSGVRLSITLPKYAEINNSHDLKRYLNNHESKKYSKTPIKNIPKDKDTEVDPWELEFDISREEAEKIYGPDWKSVILAEQLTSHGFETLYLEPKNKLDKPVPSISPKTSHNTIRMYILGFMVTSFLLATLSVLLPPVMHLLQFGIMSKIPLIDGIPIIHTLIFVGALSIILSLIINSINSFNSQLPQSPGPAPINSYCFDQPLRKNMPNYEINYRDNENAIYKI